MNLYDMFGSKELNENGIAGEYYQDNGVASTTAPENNISPMGSGTNEARVYQADQKVNVIYHPHRSNRHIMVAKAIDQMLAQRVIDSYVHKSQVDPNKVPLNGEDFILQPVMDEDQYGGGFGGGSVAPVTDSTSPIHGFDESQDDEVDYDDDYQDMVKRVGQKAKAQQAGTTTKWVPHPHGTGGNYKVVPNDTNDLGQLASYLQQKGQEVDEHIGKVSGGYRLYSHKGKNLGTYPSKAGAEKRERQVNYFKHVEEDSPASRELIRIAKRNNPEATSDQDAVFGYLNTVANKTQDNYKQVNNILRQLDPLSSELDQTEKDLDSVENVSKTQQDVLRRLNHRLDQVRKQTLPSQQRAKNPEKTTAHDPVISKEIDTIKKKLDMPAQEPKQPVQQQPVQQQPVQQQPVQQQPVQQQVKQPKDDDTKKDVAQLRREFAHMKQKFDQAILTYGAGSEEAKKYGAFTSKLAKDIAGLKNKSEPLTDIPQQELPFNEDGVMESRLYAMKKAGYDIL